MKIGVIADDFTGATDIASFLVENGISAIQLNGIPDAEQDVDSDAVVISLKSRSAPKEEAIESSLDALKWLQAKGCQQFYFKYCSTFDSTPKGNIGPVTDALLAVLDEQVTIISPALPINGRTVYKGYLFVLDELLADSPMKNHPLNPMTDSSLLRLMEMQSKGKAGLISSDDLDKGVEFVKTKINNLKKDDINYIVMDALTEQHLLTQGEATQGMKLVTGGSGLAIGLARAHQSHFENNDEAKRRGYPVPGKAVILSGSCSAMTNRQVALYATKAPALSVDISKVIDEASRIAYAKSVTEWITNQSINSELAPLIYATRNPGELAEIQQKYGAEKASHSVEQFFELITESLKESDIKRFIIAGGETSGVVSQTLDIQGFHIGPTISPGVPWVKDLNQDISLTLKSGNFGDEDFFARAQLEFPA